MAWLRGRAYRHPDLPRRWVFVALELALLHATLLLPPPPVIGG